MTRRRLIQWSKKKIFFSNLFIVKKLSNVMYNINLTKVQEVPSEIYTIYKVFFDICWWNTRKKNFYPKKSVCVRVNWGKKKFSVKKGGGEFANCKRKKVIVIHTRRRRGSSCKKKIQPTNKYTYVKRSKLMLKTKYCNAN